MSLSWKNVKKSENWAFLEVICIIHGFVQIAPHTARVYWFLIGQVFYPWFCGNGASYVQTDIRIELSVFELK